MATCLEVLLLIFWSRRQVQLIHRKFAKMWLCIANLRLLIFPIIFFLRVMLNVLVVTKKENILIQRHVEHQSTSTYSPHQNGAVRGGGQILFLMTRVMLRDNFLTPWNLNYLNTKKLHTIDIYFIGYDKESLSLINTELNQNQECDFR